MKYPTYTQEEMDQFEAICDRMLSLGGGGLSEMIKENQNKIRVNSSGHSDCKSTIKV